DLVGDEELQAISARWMQGGDDALFAPVLEDHTEEPLGDGGAITLGAGLTERLLLNPRLTSALAEFVRVRLDDRVLELAAAVALVLVEEMLQVAHECVELGQARLDVNIDLNRLFERADETPRTLAQGEAVIFRRVDTLVNASTEEVRHHDDRGDDH